MRRRDTPRVLIIGGTAEARALAAAAVAEFGDTVDVITALAGRTSAPAAIPGRVRRGGFGGADGLAAFLTAEAIDLLVDAAHPFAAIMHANALLAAERTGVPRLLISRPNWQRQPGDRWIEVADMTAAAAVLPALGRRVWLTVGIQDLSAFVDVPDTWFLVRRMEPGPVPLAAAEVVVDRGPYTLAGERALLERHAIAVVVTKASGGEATAAKLEAARQAGLPVVMIKRPPPQPGNSVGTVADALDWMKLHLKLAFTASDWP